VSRYDPQTGYYTGAVKAVVRTRVIQASFNQKLPHYVSLTRLNRPIGIFLLLWPMLWALWFAADGWPNIDVLIIFVLGTVLTRSAGCAINDFADRHVDGHVARTRHRPLATGALSGREALAAAAVLMLVAFALVLLTNRLTITLSFIALLLASVYPFAKRFTHLAQVFLGAAFAFAIPMAYAAQTGALPPLAWILFVIAACWAVAYDTLYAMADREDDLKIGVKSTAILLGNKDILATGIIQLVVLASMVWVGMLKARGAVYFLALAAALVLVCYQLYLVRERNPQRCIQAFLNNNYLGLVVFVGIVIDYELNTPTALLAN